MADQRILLVDLTAAVDEAGTEKVVRLSSIGYTTKPGEVPANAHYAPRLKRLDAVRRQMFSGDRTSGASSIGLGEIVFANVDRELDALRKYSFGGRPVELRVGTAATAFADMDTVLRVTAGGVEVGDSELTVRLKDRQSELDRVLQPNVYGGTNALPLGVDGSDDLKGKTIPRTYGTVFNVRPPCVNTAKLIYQVNDGEIQSLVAYDGGDDLVAGADYADLDDMIANEPADSQYRVWMAGGMFRLGSDPEFEITADVVEALDADSTTAQVIKRMALDVGIDAGDISADDVTALDAASSAVIGVYVDTDRTAIDAMDEAAPGAGAFFGFDRAGVLRMGQFALPVGTPVATIDEHKARKLERVPTLDALPTWRVKVEYARNHNVQTSGLAGAIAADRRARLAQEVLSVTASDAGVKTQWLDAQEVTVRTPLAFQEDAQAEADRLQALRGAARDPLKLTGVQFTKDLDIGKVVSVKWNRWGLDAGEPFLIIDMEADDLRGRCDLTLWGTCP